MRSVSKGSLHTRISPRSVPVARSVRDGDNADDITIPSCSFTCRMGSVLERFHSIAVLSSYTVSSVPSAVNSRPRT